MDESFQVGADKYNYIYSATEMTFNDAPVYKCRRGRKEDTEVVFWLARDTEGHWVAREAHKDNKNPAAGSNVFKTQHPIDITSPGEVEWMWYDEKYKTWKDFEHAFTTKRQRVEK